MTNHKILKRNILTALILVTGLLLPAWADEHLVDINFIAMGDPQYGGGAADKNRFQITAMNTYQGIAWSKHFKSFGGTMVAPLGVLIVGDLTQNGRDGRGIFAGENEIGMFTKDYGLTGNDGLLHYPVYEGYGNHDFDADEKPDGFGTWQWFYGDNPTPAVAAVVTRNRQRNGLTAVDTLGGHYSWDWGPVHFVNLNLFCGDKKSHATQLMRNPHKSLSFLQQDLKKHVAQSGRPVIIMQHYGFDNFGKQERWWTDADKKTFKQAIAAYNIIAIIHGHTHASYHYKWEGYDIYNVGSPYYLNYNQDHKGHFTVFRITDSFMDVADVAWTPAQQGRDPHITGWSHSKAVTLGKTAVKN